MNREQLVGASIAEAEKWLGTPWHHMADVRGVGVDCAMFLVRVFVDIGQFPAIDPRPYPPDWMMHRSEERFLGWVRKFADEVEQHAAGDMVTFRVGRCFAHGGLVINERQMIHADRDAGKVERCDLSRWQDRGRKYWRVRLDG